MSAGEKASPHVKDFDPESEVTGRALVPSVMKLNEEKVKAGFWPKIRRVAAGIPFAKDVLSVWYCSQDDETPIAAKAMMLAALAYFVIPTDAIPDFIAGLGYTDDAAVFAALLGLVGKNLRPHHRDAARRKIDELKGEG